MPAYKRPSRDIHQILLGKLSWVVKPQSLMAALRSVFRMIIKNSDHIPIWRTSHFSMFTVSRTKRMAPMGMPEKIRAVGRTRTISMSMVLKKKRGLFWMFARKLQKNLMRLCSPSERASLSKGANTKTIRSGSTSRSSRPKCHRL